jgi:hypothetical protein
MAFALLLHGTQKLSAMIVVLLAFPKELTAKENKRGTYVVT